MWVCVLGEMQAGLEHREMSVEMDEAAKKK